MKINKKLYTTPLTILMIGVVLFIISINFVKNNNKNKELQSKGFIAKGILIQSNLRPKSGKSIDVYARFEVEGTSYSSNSLVKGIYPQDFKQHFINKSFPVIYVPENPIINEILITPDRFKKYAIPFPDSLNWVLKYWNYEYKRFD